MNRLIIAAKAFWQILRSADTASAWEQFRAGAPAAADVQAAPAEPAAERKREPAFPADAVYALVLLQREGRLVDFLKENIEGYEDAQIGAAVRQIHAGCRRVLDEHFHVAPIRDEQEGSRLTVPAGYDPSRIRLTGRLAGEPPVAGTLRHRGWHVAAVDFPERHAKIDPHVICPAEVEV